MYIKPSLFKRISAFKHVGQRFSGLHAAGMSVLGLLIFCLLASQAIAAPLKKARLMPLWTPQAQFAGYFVALDKGIYVRHGIDLEILKSGPGYSPLEALQRGETDFAILWLTTALRHQASDGGLKHLSQTIQRSSLMLIARDMSGINTIADMHGRKVGLWGGDLSLPAHALFAARGVRVKEIRQSQTVNLFLRGGVDVTSAMWYNEYHTILNSGVEENELRLFFLDREGMYFPEDGIYAMAHTVNRDPALADAFVAASMEGWRYAFEHPEEALDIVIKYMRAAHLPANRVHQRWMLKRMQDLMQAAGPDGQSGRLNEKALDEVQDFMLRMQQLKRAVPYHEFVSKPDGR